MSANNRLTVGRRVELGFERILWTSRLMILFAVVGSLLVALSLVILTSVEVATVLKGALQFVAGSSDQALGLEFRLQMIGRIVGMIDAYLLVAVLVVFSLGLYELFIGKIDIVEGSEFARRLLLIRTLDDLKDRLARVVMLILVVKFLQLSLQLKLKTPMDVLFLAGGIGLVGVAIFLSGHKGHER